jgi:hypothetical protein
MLRRGTVALARFTARLFVRGTFVGLLAFALTVAGTSFLTACKCNDFVIVQPPHDPPIPTKDNPTPPQAPQPEGN